MIKYRLVKILFAIAAILLVCFFGGLPYIHYDYYTNTSPYASTPLSVYYLIHGLIFLPASILCFTLALILRSGSTNKS